MLHEKGSGVWTQILILWFARVKWLMQAGNKDALDTLQLMGSNIRTSLSVPSVRL